MSADTVESADAAEPRIPRRPIVRHLLLGTAAALCVVVAVAIALIAPPLPALGALIGLIVVALFVNSARDATAVFTLLLVLLLIIPERYVLVGPLKSVGYPAMLVGFLAGIVWLSGRLLGRIPAHRRHPVHWVIFGFLFTAATAVAAGSARALTGFELAGLVRAIFPVLAAVGIGLLANDGITSRRRLDTLLQRLVMISAIAACIGIAEFAFHSFTYTSVLHIPGLTVNGEIADDVRSDFTRVLAAAAHPIEYAVASATVVPLALHYSRFAPSPGMRKLFILCAGALIVVLPLTVSRSAILAVAVAIAVYAVDWSPRGRLNALVIAAIGAVAFRAAVPGLLGTLRSFFLKADQDPSIQGRTEDYARIPSLLENHWIFGRGLGTFRPAEYFYLDNQYLGSLLEGGVVALIALIAVYVVGMGMARGARKHSIAPATRSLGQALAAGIAALAVSAFTFDEFSFKQTAFLLFLLLGCSGALWRMTRAPFQPRLRHKPVADNLMIGSVRK